MNNDNLIKNYDLTPEERSAKASKMGIASAESRRKRKALKEVAEILLSRDIDDEALKNLLEEKGYEDKTNQALMVLRLFETACNTNSKTQVAAFQEIKKLIGEDTPQNVNLNMNVTPTLDEQAKRITAVMKEYAEQYKSDE